MEERRRRSPFGAVLRPILAPVIVALCTSPALAQEKPPAAEVAPDGAQNLELLPGNGTDYTATFKVHNSGTSGDVFRLDAFPSPGRALKVVSVHGVAGDTALAKLAAGDAVGIDVVYSVGNLPAGTVDSLYLRARAASDSTISDTGFVDVLVVRPDITTTKAVAPGGIQPPGTDLTYTSTLTNTGTEFALDVIWVESLPAEVEFQVGSVVTSFPAGIVVVVKHSNDDGSSWTYGPVSAGCGAAAGYDGCVTDIRWTLQNPLPSGAPDNAGTMEYVARIE